MKNYFVVSMLFVLHRQDKITQKLALRTVMANSPHEAFGIAYEGASKDYPDFNLASKACVGVQSILSTAEVEHLNWIYKRMCGTLETENVDYMIKFKDILDKLKA